MLTYHLANNYAQKIAGKLRVKSRKQLRAENRGQAAQPCAQKIPS
jgi:hypothetical protein